MEPETLHCSSGVALVLQLSETVKDNKEGGKQEPGVELVFSKCRLSAGEDSECT